MQATIEQWKVYERFQRRNRVWGIPGAPPQKFLNSDLIFGDIPHHPWQPVSHSLPVTVKSAGLNIRLR